MRIIYVLCILPFLWLTATFAQQSTELTVSGTVVNENGEPLSNVSIYLKDKSAAGTSTDDNGKFSIQAVYGDRVVLSYVGYNPVEHLATESNNNLTISLSEKGDAIEEVVVVGIGAQQRKISSVGAITTADVKDLQSPEPTIANMLGGQAADVISMKTSREPGKNIAHFWVRDI